MDAYKNAIIKIRSVQNKITIIDIGCARCSFINEFLIKYFDRSNIKCIGVDPLLHTNKQSWNASINYNYYIEGCVDNIPRGTITQSKLYVNSIDQASSLLRIKTDNMSSDLNDRDNKFFYPQDIIDRLSRIDKEIIVNVYNLCDIIDKCFDNNENIDFIKIDAEGKDVDITKSLKPYLHRIKYIGVECSSHINNNLRIFENGSTLQDAFSFFKENNFDIFEITDYSKKTDNLTQMSDIVFINNSFK
jgi:hypothetical protein